MRHIILILSLLCSALCARGQHQQAPSGAQPDATATPSAHDSTLTEPLRVRAGGNVQAARIIKRVPPVYPPLARQTGVQGTVRLHVIVAKDGKMKQLEVMTGPLLLQKAALDAVKKWRYQPTLLNGKPVEVDTTIDVVFALKEKPSPAPLPVSPPPPGEPQ